MPKEMAKQRYSIPALPPRQVPYEEFVSSFLYFLYMKSFKIFLYISFLYFLDILYC